MPALKVHLCHWLCPGVGGGSDGGDAEEVEEEEGLRDLDSMVQKLQVSGIGAGKGNWTGRRGKRRGCAAAGWAMQKARFD